MGGFLYKDFIAVKGRKILIILIAATLLFLCLRLALPGADFAESKTVSESFEGTGDFFLWTFPFLCALSLFGLPSVLMKGFIAQDEKNKISAFSKSLPLSKNAYIAAKYIFLGVAVYAALSVSFIWCEIGSQIHLCFLLATFANFILV